MRFPFSLFLPLLRVGAEKADLVGWNSYGTKYKVDRVFGNNGEIVSGATTAAPYKNQLLLTGELSSRRSLLPRLSRTTS